MNTFFRVSLLAALSAVPGVAAAQSPNAETPFAFDGPPVPVAPEVVTRDADGRATVRAVRLSSPLRIDGALDEALYNGPSVSGFVQVEPALGVAATENTEVWVAFDDDNVYFAFRCWDSAPERRVSTDMRRDVNNFINGNDIVQVFLDTFYDRRNGLSFTMNSIGARNDGQQIGPQYNADWNPIWEHALGEFEGGWTLEMALPFRSIRYRPGQAQIWGLNVLRSARWKNELSVLTPVPAGRGNSSAQYAALAATLVGIEAPPAALNLDVKPYAISTLTSSAGVSNDLGKDAGLDVKYAVTQNLAADFTLNTDFAQVEADEQQINLTRFSLFFPEKREFFLENRDTFTFGGVSGGGGDAPVLFYSRRIGLDGGRAVPIDGGGRLTGRVGRYTVGALNIQTDDVPDAGVRATNFSVVRVRRDILSESAVGALVTRRSAGQGGGGANTAYGLDGAFNFFNDLAINTYWARTETDGVSGGDTSYRAQLNFPGDRYGVQLERLRVGEHFNPEVGFVRRPDIRRTLAEFRFSPRPRSMPSIRRLVWAGSVDYFENGAGRMDTRDRTGGICDRVPQRRPRRGDVHQRVRVHPRALPNCDRSRHSGRRLRLAERAPVVQFTTPAPRRRQPGVRARHLLQRSPHRLVDQPRPACGHAPVRPRAHLFVEQGRPRAGGLYRPPGRFPRHRHDVTADVCEHAGAVQLGKSCDDGQRPVSLGISARQRAVHRLQ